MKFQAVPQKTAINVRGLLFAAPCILLIICVCCLLYAFSDGSQIIERLMWSYNKNEPPTIGKVLTFTNDRAGYCDVYYEAVSNIRSVDYVSFL